MFTGIIEQMGRIDSVTQKSNLWTVVIECPAFAKAVHLGDSVAINGICLTVVGKTAKALRFEAMQETAQATTLLKWQKGQWVNCELALRPIDRMGGHFVTGHVDCTTPLRERITQDKWVVFRFNIPKGFRRYFVPKGSVAIDGISLTVGRVTAQYFEVYIIPYTLKVTTFGALSQGDHVNIETDVLAKYVLGVKGAS